MILNRLKTMAAQGMDSAVSASLTANSIQKEPGKPMEKQTGFLR